MKTTLVIIITLTIIFTGCSKSYQGDINISEQNIKDTEAKIVLSSNNNKIQNTNSITDQSQFEKGYYDYQGSINNKMFIHMSIYPLGGEMVGSYFYDTQRKEIKLKGSAGAQDIILYEYYEAGKNTGRFIGTMDTVDIIKGTWISGDNTKSYPFKLELASIIPGAEYGKRYAIAAANKSDKQIEGYVSKIQSLVMNDDKKQVAEEVSYPINVNINGSVTKITNKDEFINKYDQIFHHKYKEVISNAYTKYLFANWQGIMFGEGNYNMWINEIGSRLKITAINN